jgi:hypothetical protein
VSLASSKIISGAQGRGLQTPSSSRDAAPHACAATSSVTHAPSHATRPSAHPQVAPFCVSAPAGHTGHPPRAALGHAGRDAHAAAHAHSAATSANAVLARCLLFMSRVLLPCCCVHSSAHARNLRACVAFRVRAGDPLLERRLLHAPRGSISVDCSMDHRLSPVPPKGTAPSGPSRGVSTSRGTSRACEKRESRR